MSKNDKGSSLPKPLRWIVDSWKAVVAVAGGLTTILVLVFTLFPGEKPAEPCRGALGGKLSRVTVDQRVRYRAYLELEGASAGNASTEQLDAVGRLVHFTIDTKGYKGKRLPIYWWVLTVGGEPLPEPGLRRQLALEISPEDCADGGRRAIWVKLPKEKGRFEIRVRLFDSKGGELDDITTPPFTA